MIYGYLCIFFFTIVLAFLEETVSSSPCKLISNEPNIVRCANVTDFEQLHESLSRMKDLFFNELHIIHSSVMYLPGKLFDGLLIEKIELINSTFMDLSDTEVAFAGLENSLEWLTIKDCRVYNGWTWAKLKNLKNLLSLTIQNSGLDVIDHDITGIAGLSRLHWLFLEKDTVSYVDEKAFSHFKSVGDISLNDNQISAVKRSMFPNPAMSLGRIYLSNNRIENLPDDIFTNMPKLNSLFLSGNKLLVIAEPVFSPVWKQLHIMRLYGNPLRCDCRMQWAVKAGFPELTSGNCDEPPELRNKHIAELKMDDLPFCGNLEEQF